MEEILKEIMLITHVTITVKEKVLSKYKNLHLMLYLHIAKNALDVLIRFYKM